MRGSVGGKPAELVFTNLGEELGGRRVDRTAGKVRLPTVTALVAVVRVSGPDEIWEHRGRRTMLGRLVGLVHLHGPLRSCGSGHGVVCSPNRWW
jgi:hypothetical protein